MEGTDTETAGTETDTRGTETETPWAGTEMAGTDTETAGTDTEAALEGSLTPAATGDCAHALPGVPTTRTSTSAATTIATEAHEPQNF